MLKISVHLEKCTYTLWILSYQYSMYENTLYLFQGELTITSDMEELENALFLDQVSNAYVLQHLGENLTTRGINMLNACTQFFASLF